MRSYPVGAIQPAANPANCRGWPLQSVDTAAATVLGEWQQPIASSFYKHAHNFKWPQHQHVHVPNMIMFGPNLDKNRAKGIRNTADSW